MSKLPTRKAAAVKNFVEYVTKTAANDKAPRKIAKTGIGRIMYIECKSGGITGPAKIGRVTFSKTGQTLYYKGQRFQSLKGAGFKSNYFDLDTGEEYWISGPKRNGADGLYGGSSAEIDEDVREEYWTIIRRRRKESLG